MKPRLPKLFALAVLASLVAGTSHARPPGPRGVSQEQLATVPDLTTAQQDAIYRIESERRAAHKALLDKERPAHRQIEEQTTQKLRAALGDEGYATYAAWKLERHAGRRHARHQRMHDGHQDGGGDSEPSEG